MTDHRNRELRAHCLTFCSALNRHHTGEDDGAFPAPRPVLEELRRDHRLGEDSLQRLEALLGGLLRFDGGQAAGHGLGEHVVPAQALSIGRTAGEIPSPTEDGIAGGVRLPQCRMPVGSPA